MESASAWERALYYGFQVKGKVCVLIALFFSWFTRDSVAKLLSKLNV